MTFRLVALGDSTVEGLEDPGPDGRYVGWADRFARHLSTRHPDLTYANLAVRGLTSGEVRATQLERAIELGPDAALLVAGVNDLLRPRLDRAALRDNLLTMFRRLHEADAQVLTFTMPDMARVAPLAIALRPRIEYLNSVVREAGVRHGTIVVDLAAEPVASHPALWHDDRLHANPEGHRRIAAALAEAVGVDVGVAAGAGDWRTEPAESIPSGWARIVAGETRWVAAHLLPWAWRHLLNRPDEPTSTSKRPELLPLS